MIAILTAAKNTIHLVIFVVMSKACGIKLLITNLLYFIRNDVLLSCSGNTI
jgi:hypothetical protein